MEYCKLSRQRYLAALLQRRPIAVAHISGETDYPEIRGNARFYQTPWGVLVSLQVTGLPTAEEPCQAPIFACHIHSGVTCDNPKTHYNPDNCPHPQHAGDLPPLFGCDGYAYSTVLTDRFAVNEVIGKTVIIHQRADDFTTQPSGNAGDRIACGEIYRI